MVALDNADPSSMSTPSTTTLSLVRAESVFVFFWDVLVAVAAVVSVGAVPSAALPSLLDEWLCMVVVLGSERHESTGRDPDGK